MLKIYNKAHVAAGHIKAYKDLKIESVVSNGDKTLSFTYMGKKEIETEFYIQTQTDEYVVKEKSQSLDGFPQFVAVLNLEELEGKPWNSFSAKDSTIDDAARLALAGTGWTIGECNVKKKRNAGMLQVTSRDILEKLATAFMCEIVYDTKKKTVSFYNETGEDKGAYFIRGLNLKKLNRKSDSYDYYTQIIPIGANNLTIEKVNDGKKYLENYQYSNKVRAYIWKDESYTDAQALKDDAELKLRDLSKPIESYSVTVLDLAKQKREYSVLSYHVGDKVWLIDSTTRTRVKQRITKMTEYPQSPEKNTCEIANTVLTFEELQQKYKEAAEVINTVVSGDGRYTGTISVSDILNFEQGLTDSEILDGVKNSIDSLNGSVKEIKLSVGSIESNYIKSEEADLKYAAIDFSNIGEASIENLFSKYGLIENLVLKDGYITGELVGVTIKGDLIEGGTVKADKLVVKGEDGIYYKLNIEGGEFKDGEEIPTDELHGSVIAAKSITAEKVSVTDLVAFGATIGGFRIGEKAIYSGLKGAVSSPANGIYMDSDGQIAVGNTQNFIKYYKDESGKYHLSIAAESITFGASGTNVEDLQEGIDDAAKTATDYMNFDENGLVIGDMTTSELGRNIRIDSDSVDIRNGEDVLASFAEDLIELGKVSDNAKLSMMNGLANFEIYTEEIEGTIYRNTSLYTKNDFIIAAGTESHNDIAFEQPHIWMTKGNNDEGKNEIGFQSGSPGAMVIANEENIQLEVTNETGTFSTVNVYSGSDGVSNKIILNASGSNQVVVTEEKTTMSKPLEATLNGNASSASKLTTNAGSNTQPIYFANGIPVASSFGHGINKALYGGAMYMTAGHTVSLYDKISNQTNGIVIVFSKYVKDDPSNAYYWQSFYIPKYMLNLDKGRVWIFTLNQSKFGNPGTKALYITDTTITGNADNNKSGTANGVTYNNAEYVLRYVIGV